MAYDPSGAINALQRGARNRGAFELEGARAVSDMVTGLGQTAAGYFQHRAEQQQQAALSRQDQAFLDELAAAEAEGREPRLRMYDPKRASALVELWRQTRRPETKEDPKVRARLLRNLSPGLKQQAWQRMRAEGTKLGVELPEAFDESTFNAMLDAYDPPEKSEGFTLSPGQQRFGPDGKPVASVPEAPKTPAVGSFEAFVTGKYGASPTPEQVLEARKLYGQADDRIIIQRDERGLTPNAEASLISRLARDFDSAAKPAKELRRQAGVVRNGMESAKRGDLNAGAQQVLVGFQKMLDEISVVREGEFARSADGQSFIQRAQGAYEKFTRGGQGVTLKSLEEFARAAEDLAKAYDGYVKATEKRIRTTADRFNLPHELVITDYGFGATNGPVQIKGADDYKALPSGAEYIDPKGVRRRKP